MMSETIKKLFELKNEIAIAIAGKLKVANVTSDFKQYPALIDDINATPIGYKRDFNLLTLPEVDLDNYEQKIVLLYTVLGDEREDSISFKIITQNYAPVTVNWGDGFVETLEQGGIFNHTYDYQNIESALTTEGHKQCIVTIESIDNFYAVDFSSIKTTYGAISRGYTSAILSIPYLDTAYVRALIPKRTLDTDIVIGDLLTVTTLYGLGLDRVGVKSITIGDIPKVTSLSRALGGMTEIIDVEIGDAPLVTTAYSMLSDAVSLQNFKIGVLTKCTDYRYLFMRAISLVNYSFADLTAMTTGYGMFYLSGIKEIILPDLPNVTSLSYLARDCNNLEYLEIGNAPLCTNITRLTYGVRSIKVIKIGNINSATEIDTYFAYYSRSLESLTIGNIDGLTNPIILRRLSSLKEFNVNLSNFKLSIDLGEVGLSHDRLVQVLEQLPTVDNDSAITLTGAVNATALTEEEEEIPINKGWLIVGT